jgi:hypothetical protein
MADENVSAGAGGASVAFDSPPLAALPAKVEVDPRARLHDLARELIRSRNRRAIMEYLRLRRSLR